jgi:peptidyl-prolyl cis-trans isomerase B (cyclophilin B)
LQRAGTDSHFGVHFRVAKLIGDSRAVVAEKGFNRPYEKITISKCGEVR